MNFDLENLILIFRRDDKVVFEIFRVSGPEAGEQAAQQITCGAVNPYRSPHFCPVAIGTLNANDTCRRKFCPANSILTHRMLRFYASTRWVPILSSCS